jgi:hypothetical protein
MLYKKPKKGDIVTNNSRIILVVEDFYNKHIKEAPGKKPSQVSDIEFAKNMKPFMVNEIFTVIDVQEDNDSASFSMDWKLTNSWYIVLLHSSGTYVLYSKNDMTSSMFNDTFDLIKYT